MVMKHEGGQVVIEEVLEVVPTLFEASLLQQTCRNIRQMQHIYRFCNVAIPT
jgi:hypothetical protein